MLLVRMLIDEAFELGDQPTNEPEAQVGIDPQHRRPQTLLGERATPRLKPL